MITIVLLQTAIIVYLIIHIFYITHRIKFLNRPIENISLEVDGQDEASETASANTYFSPPLIEMNGADIIEKNKELFERIHQTIVDEQLFLDPEFSRDKFIRLGLINKNKVAQMLQQCANTNFNGYINKLRLEYARKLMQEQPETPIKAIAIDAGFNTIRTFYRIFERTYGMTPMKYKESLCGECFEV